MVKDDVQQFFQRVLPFRFLADKELKLLAEHVSVESYPKNTVILRQDDHASDVLRIINKGGVKVSLRTGDSEEIVIDHRGEGDTFGLLSMVGKDEKQKTTVTATEDTTCFLLKKEQVLSVIEAHPEFTEYFLQFHFSKYIDKTSRELRSRSLFFGSGDHLLLTTQVGDVATKDVVTVPQDASIREAAQVMSRHHISSLIIVGDNGLPVGIITDRDLREKVVARSKNVTDMVKDIMTLPMIRVDVKDYCFEAVLKMIKHNVHHVLVIKDGQLGGVLTNHDLMMLQGTSPLSFSKDLESQTSIEGLVPVSRKINRMVGLLLKEGANVSNITRILTELNDRLVRKVLEITEKKFGKPPVSYCWISFGSEGRKEQTFRTDQDNAIIYADPGSQAQEEDAKRYFGAFAVFIRDSLEQCGFPPCRADYMASNPRWCQSLAVWKRYFTEWMQPSNQEDLIRSLIFFDFRLLHGDESLTAGLRDHITGLLKEQNGFLTQVASAITKNRPPLGFFKTLIVEKDGEHKDELNLTTRGIRPIVDIVRLFALETGIAETSTLERIYAMKGTQSTVVLHKDELVQAFEYLMLLWIHHQAEQVAQGLQPDNFINPSRLNNLQRRILKESFQMITRLQDSVVDHYQLARVGA